MEKGEEDRMVSYDKSTQCQYNPSGTAKVSYNYTDCVHRLPCGYCPLLNRQCPRYYSNTITWTSNNGTKGMN